MIIAGNDELQAKCLNKIMKENIDLLRNQEFKNKISYNLCCNDINTISDINSVNEISRIIEKSIGIGNYKKALRYLCILKSKIHKIINEL